MKKIVLATLLCISLLLSGCSDKKDIQQPQNQQQQATSKQISAKQRIASIKKLQHGGICYSNTVVEYDDCFFIATDNGLEKADKQFNSSEILIASPDISSLYLYENKLYYATNTDIYCYDINTGLSQDIYSIDLIDNSKYEWICIGLVCDFYINSEKIYIRVSGDSAFEIDLKTKKEEIFLDDFISFAVINNTKYYIDSVCKTFSIYRTDLTSGDTALVRGDGLGRYDKTELSERYDGVIAIGDTLYYSMRTPKYGIFRYNESGNDEIIVDTKEDSHLKLSGARNDDCFYYIVYDKIESDGHSYSSTIYEYSENGSRELMHIDNHISSFTVPDSYIFYQLSHESPVEAYLRTDQ